MPGPKNQIVIQPNTCLVNLINKGSHHMAQASTRTVDADEAQRMKEIIRKLRSIRTPTDANALADQLEKLYGEDPDLPIR